VKVAVAQVRAAVLDVEENLCRVERVIAEAASGGAGLVVLPELVATGYTLDLAGLSAAAEGGDGGGPVLSAWSRLAREHEVAVIGGFVERDGLSLYNSVAVIDRGGQVLGTYRKLHLFGDESTVFRPGDRGLPIFVLDGIKVGVLVCYDLRFPEAARLLALRGAELIAAPAAWVTGFDASDEGSGERIGQVAGALVQANLNQVYIACSDQCAATDEFRFLGRSLVASPFGKPVVGPLDADSEELALAEVDPEVARDARERAPGISPREDRRTDVYALRMVGEDTAPDGDQLLAEIERRRGYVLDAHRMLADADPAFLARYDEFLEATFLQERLLDRRTKEFVYVAALMALGTPRSHLETHMKAAVANGGTPREVLQVIEQVLAPAGVPRFLEALEAFKAAFPDFPADESRKIAAATPNGSVAS
jgi:predicted amidohydrolase/alkylhydroperoxidase/carboxymuconolactone decarboxylase family protein YurZ